MALPIYNPVNSTQGEIRLLTLNPARKHEAPLVGNLSHVKFSQHPTYDALSYTWGAEGTGGDIQLNGQLFRLRENAEAALRHLRLPSKIRILWIDAICINQQDDKEKEGQLLLMKDIYERAGQVCIWLGEVTDTSHIGLYDLQTRVAKEYKIWSHQARDRVVASLIGPTGILVNGTNSVAVQFTANLTHELDLGEIRELLNRPWWTRVWIMQEAIVARKLTLMCGAETFGWEGIERSVKRMRSLRGAVEVFDTVVNPEVSMLDETYRIITHFRDIWAKGKWNVSIYQLLYEFRHLECTDPRDRIFGFLGLASTATDFAIVPDYTASTTDVFIKSARAIISRSNSLNLLNCKREWKGVQKPPRPTFAYSLRDQAKYHDIAGTVTDGPGSAPRKGWVKLPSGWERVQAGYPRYWSPTKYKKILAGKTCHYVDHNTGTIHETSPLALIGQPPSLSQHVVKQRILPPGWIKQWDNVGRAQVTYAPNQYDSKPKVASIKAGLSGLPSWAPNWSAGTHLDPEPLLDWSEENPRYWAAGKTATVLDLSQSSSRTLGVEGILFDKIAHIAEPWHPTSDVPPITRAGITVLEKWEALALCDVSSCPYIDTGGRQGALWRTLITDYAGHRAAPQSDWSMVELWYDRTGWGKQLPDIDEMASKGIASTAAATVDIQHLDSDMYSALLELDFANAKMFSSAKKYGEYLRRIHRVCSHRALCVTEKGYIGLAPWNAAPGDLVCVLKGGNTPFLLRQVPVVGRYTLVGETYIYGIMSSEVLSWEHAEAATQMFYLV